MISAELLKFASIAYTKQDTLHVLQHLMNLHFDKYEINTINRMLYFIAQTAHETDHFCHFYEMGGRQYFDKYEPGTSIGKMLGNTEKGDGFKYRGRGMIMITGRDNYKRYGEIIGTDILYDPNKAAEFPYSFILACEFWKGKKINKLCDSDDFSGVTRKINGGLNGLKERKKIYDDLVQFCKINALKLQ